MFGLLSAIAALQIGGFYGGSIGNTLLVWEQAGFFSYILPFLLIFAIVFGILMRTKIFEQNKGLNAVIAICIGLLALQFDFVPYFFAEIFPRLGIGLSVILTMLILIGMFLPAENNKYANWLLLITAVIVFIVVLAKSFGQFWWGGSILNWFTYHPNVIVVAIVIIAIVAVVASSTPRVQRNIANYPTPVWRAPP